MPPTAAIIFDCDGVLVDSEPLANRVLSGILTENGVPMSPDECHEAFVGLNPRGVGAKLRDMRGIDLTHALVTEAVPRFMRVLESSGLPPIAGVVALLDVLRARRIPFAVASNSPIEELRLKLRLSGLTDYFAPHIHSGDALGMPKPNPGVYLHAAVALDTPPASCTVVEDTPTGTTAGVRAGMRVIGFCGTHPAIAPRLLNAGASQVVSDYSALTRALGLGPI